ncbi:MAG: hypothetical protein ACRDT5_01660 [Mycobacterium sp.]
MAIRIRNERAPVRRREPYSGAGADNRLAFLDQASFLGLRATGLGALAQCVWVYQRAIDIDALRRFHHNLGHGLLGRRIERSPLPFARHRWISWPGPSDIDIADDARPPAELSAWAEERAQLPLDPEWGPSWHLGVLPLTDGSTAISLVFSHTVVDGRGGARAIADAVAGHTRDLGYPPPRSRTRLRVAVQDARQTAQGAPEVARALIAAAKLARRRRHDIARSGAPRPIASGRADRDDAIVVPRVTIHIDLDDWDARAKALGGTSNSLLAGFAAKLAERLGRRRGGDGAVTLNSQVSDRTEDDTRGNALSLASVSVDPTRVTTDLRDVRAAIKAALRTLGEVPDESLLLLPLTPLVPKRVVNRLLAVAFSDAELPVGCSNLGDIDPAVGRPDGTDADYFSARLGDQHVTRHTLERRTSQLSLLSGRICGKIFITIEGVDGQFA